MKYGKAQSSPALIILEKYLKQHEIDSQTGFAKINKIKNTLII